MNKQDMTTNKDMNILRAVLPTRTRAFRTVSPWHLLMALALMLCFSVKTNAQEGFWFIDYGSNYYLVPAADPQQANKNDAYYSADYSVADGDPEKPFLTTYQTGGDENSKWVVTAVPGESGYFYIKHNLSGKYVVYEPPYSSYTNRKSMHLLATASPGENAKFAITVSGSNYSISPKSLTSGNMFFNVAGSNQNYYHGITPGSNPPCYGSLVGLYTSGTWHFTAVPSCSTPTITYDEATGAVSITTSTDGATIHYTTDGSTPTESSTAYTGSFTATATMTVKAIAVKAGLSNSLEASKQLVQYTYHIVNRAGNIAVKYTTTLPQAVGTSLSGYTSIPADIRSEYLSGETVTFYSFSGTYAVGDAVSESTFSGSDPINATPADGTNIYVRYTTNTLSSKFLPLSHARPYNIKYSSNYLYDNSGTLATVASGDATKTDREYLWYVTGSDPYAVEVQNSSTNNYLTYSSPSFSLSASSTTFILKSTAYVDATYETVTLRNASGEEVTVTVNTVVLPLSFTLIDKAGRVIESGISYSGTFELPEAWQSPLATYHYWNTTAFVCAEETGTPNEPFVFVENPTEIHSATEASSDNVIYVTYDVDPTFVFSTAFDTNSSQTYRLRFIGGQKFNQEDGHDAVMSTAQQAVYPYSNGDAMLYVYGNEQWNTQLASGASTRTRWLWHVVSPTSAPSLVDPYHVYIMSQSGQVTSRNYFRTYSVTYGESSHIVTGVTTRNNAVVSDPASADYQPPTEYMILKQSSNCKLVTTALIDGERRTVNSFEQYWKNTPTVQNLLENDKVTAYETYSDNIILNSTQTAHLPSTWHTYQAFANAAPWVGWKDDNTGTGKQYKNKNHWFQTIDMGSTGEFVFEATTLAPQVILIDQHGWEIMRTALTDTETLRKYDSPMVEEYHWYPTASKAPGYHKYTVSNPKIPVYASSINPSNGRTVWSVTTDSITHTSTSLADSPYDHFVEKGYEAQDASVKTDFYVTYTVKAEYANAYAGAATAAATIASPYLLKQGGRYARIASNSLDTSSDAVDDLEAVSTDMQWYVRPNFDIDAEMGYLYAGETGAQDDAPTKAALEAEYLKAGKNGFDPYNVQIQSVANENRYFVANTTSPTVSNGAWTGTSSSVQTLNISNNLTAAGHDQTTLHITNATFMVVADGNGNMRLMPRFDHTKVMTSFTGLSTQTAAAADGDDGTGTQTLTLTLVPKVVHSSAEIGGMGGYYILAADYSHSASVGTADAPFVGTIDGKLNPVALSCPLVSYADSATIKNVIASTATISSGNDEGDTGAICCTALGNTRIYNCGINDGSVSGTRYTGGIVGFLKDYSRVINCYSYADITGGEFVAGIVGYNDYKTTSSNLRTMVMNCMFYGDITGGSDKAPVYNGYIITNRGDQSGVSNFNFFSAEATFAQNRDIQTYNCALMAEGRFLQCFEFYRLLLNSNRSLAAWWATGDYSKKDEMMKWVLETADRTIDDPKPYPVLKPQGKYPSIINIDAANAPTSGERNTGKKLGTLAVTIQMGGGAVYAAPAGVFDDAEPPALVCAIVMSADRPKTADNNTFLIVSSPYCLQTNDGRWL